MKILLSGPGTGKTTKIKELIHDDYANAENILVLSFTNATVNDLKESFKDWNNVNCFTLHSYALKINHLTDYHILDSICEFPILTRIIDKIEIDYSIISRILKFITFGDMIEKCVSFLNANPSYGRINIGKIDLLIVDEYQDFNEVERELVSYITKHSDDTIILGDDDQSIYGFKDADPQGIIDIYNDDLVEKLSNENICYRCPDKVVEYCSKLIKNNKTRIKKEWKYSKKPGEISFIQKISQKESAKYICNEIDKILSHSNGDSILILSPVRYYYGMITKELDEQGYNYADFWKKKVNIEQWKTIWWLRAIYGERKFLNLLFLSNFLSNYRKNKFVNILRDLFTDCFEEKSVIDKVLPIFADSNKNFIGNIPLLEDFFKSPQNNTELYDLMDSTDIVQSVESLSKIINKDPEFDSEGINIMSIHKSKGLQADHVFIFGLNEGILPNKARGSRTIEAQRRLLFVGMTRALKQLHLISTVEWEGRIANRLDIKQFKYIYQKKLYYGKTSTFIEEMQES